MLANQSFRADVHAVSTTEVQFAATGLDSRPIRLWALSGRQAMVMALPTAATVSGGAGTKYIYASLAAPSGDSWATILANIKSALPWNRGLLYEALRMIHPGDGTLLPSGRNSVVSLVVTTSATPADDNQFPLGEVVWDGVAITSVISYASLLTVSSTAFIHGYAQLVKTGANLVLQPADGQTLSIDGFARSLTAGGVSLDASGLTPGTFYHLYAVWSGSAITLEASTTASAQHTNGVQIKSGDSSRTYVGTAFVETGPVWSDVVPVKSRFHDPTGDVLIRATGNPFKDVVNTAAETSIFGPTLPEIMGGLLGTDEFLEIVLVGDFLNTSGAPRRFIARVKYGGTTILTLDGNTFANSATRYGWHTYGYLSASGATNAQASRAHHVASLTAGVAGTTVHDQNGTVFHSSHSSIAVDSTVDQQFDITIQNDTAHASESCRVFSAIVRRMRVR